MAEILNTGRDFFAAKQGAGLPATINRFVLAMVPGQNPADPISLAEGMPDPAHVVYTYPVSGFGYVSQDRVVYSLILTPTVGDFTFNWVGLLADDDTLIAVAHIPEQEKYSTAGGVLGNSITRNFLIEYTNAQSITGITVEAGTWQIDFVARFNQQTDLIQSVNRDFFGSQFFIDDGFKIVRAGGEWRVTAGVGYVGGVRIVKDATTAFDAGALPADIWLDVYLDKNVSTVDAVFTVVALPAGTPLADYTAPNGVNHFVAKIATLTSTIAYSDLRRVVNGADGVVADLYASWLQFLADFGGKTDFIHLTANTTLEKNSRYFSDSGLLHFLPDSDVLNIGDAIRCLRKAGDVVTYQVTDLASDTIYVPGIGEDTAVNHDVDCEIIFVWTGERYEVNYAA
jgi:hypothetical protein